MIQYNGFNVERRRMYASNPRNNLLSTVDISWQNSLHEETSPRHYLQQKKKNEHQQLSQEYNHKIDDKLQETLNLAAKSQFRVIVPQAETSEDSLANELKNYQTKQLNNSLYMRQQLMKSKKDSVGQSIFGYAIEGAPRKPNYLREAIESRLYRQKVEVEIIVATVIAAFEASEFYDQPTHNSQLLSLGGYKMVRQQQFTI